jgi:N-acetylglucosaminyldiphosphoundecaprenol N-acetyl-beta-D-mannosaminyltransferase
MDRNKGTILSVGVNSTSVGRVLAFVRDSLVRDHKFWISTPNPEIILKAQNDFDYLKILNTSDVAIPDGVGVIQWMKFLSLSNPRWKPLRYFILPLQGLTVDFATFFAKDWLFGDTHLIKGRKMFLELITLANKKAWRVYLFGGESGEAEAATENLTKNFKRVKILFAQGPKYDRDGRPVTKSDIKIHNNAVREINQFKPHLLFVALGAPKQEKWINNNLKKLNVGGAMAVGGTLNYLAGKSALPPAWMEKVGLEWLWRLISEPYRVKRIYNALVVFPYKVFVFKLNK